MCETRPGSHHTRRALFMLFSAGFMRQVLRPCFVSMGTAYLSCSSFNKQKLDLRPEAAPTFSESCACGFRNLEPNAMGLLVERMQNTLGCAPRFATQPHAVCSTWSTEAPCSWEPGSNFTVANAVLSWPVNVQNYEPKIADEEMDMLPEREVGGQFRIWQISRSGEQIAHFSFTRD